MLKIYIASPYSAETEEQRELNTMRAIDAGIQLYLQGYFPYIPHLTHWIDKRALETGVNLQWQDYINWDLCWLKECDALLYLGKSKGTDIELEEAQKTGIEVFFSIEDLLKKYSKNG